MRPHCRRIVVPLAMAAVALSLLPRISTAQIPRLGGGRFAASGGLVLPIGDLDKSGKAGFDVAIRTEIRRSDEPWAYRGSFSFTRLAGKDSVRNYQFMGYGGDVVHHTSEKFYQFAGFGMFTVKRVMEESTTSPFTNSSLREFDFGLTGGVGLNLGGGKSTAFVEFGVTHVFGDRSDFSWFPVRVGIRF